MSEESIDAAEGVTPETDSVDDDLAKVRDALAKERDLRKAAEQRAKEHKGAADELAQIRESQKSEAEKVADSLRQAQVEAEAARAELLRYRIAATHGITDADDIALFLTGSDEETLTKQATRLADRVAESAKPRTPRPDPNQGRGTAAGQGSTADSFAEFFRKSLPER